VNVGFRTIRAFWRMLGAVVELSEHFFYSVDYHLQPFPTEAFARYARSHDARPERKWLFSGAHFYSTMHAICLIKWSGIE
jgi:hypothetical protein